MVGFSAEGDIRVLIGEVRVCGQIENLVVNNRMSVSTA